MGLDWFWMNAAAALLACYVFVFVFVRRMNQWYYAFKLGKKYYSLPPGDMGWPLLGNLLSFIRAFSSDQPDSFINSLVSKYGRTGIYKTHLFGNPSIIICDPDLCRRVLTNDEHFKLGYPKSTTELARCRPMMDVSTPERRRFRRLFVAPITGHKTLAMYVERIEEVVINCLEDLSSMEHPVDLLKEMKNVTFKSLIYVFFGSKDNSFVTKIGTYFVDMIDAMFSLPINVPGFTFYKALKARKKLARLIQPIVDKRRMLMKGSSREGKKDLVDILLEVEDVDGQKLEKEDIIDLLLGFMLAGHDSTATILTWSIIHLTDHPQIMEKAKEEQEEILKVRSSFQRQIDIKEVNQMVYLDKVIDETLRLINIAFAIFREAKLDTDMNGYVIPKGWRVLVWGRAIHMDPTYYINPLEFNPSRWDDHNGKAGTFIPFGAGSRHCPGSDLARLEIHIFLHHFLVNYKLERVNKKCRITYLPIPKPIDDCFGKVIKISSY